MTGRNEYRPTAGRDAENIRALASVAARHSDQLEKDGDNIRAVGEHIRALATIIDLQIAEREEDRSKFDSLRRIVELHEQRLKGIEGTGHIQ